MTTTGKNKGGRPKSDPEKKKGRPRFAVRLIPSEEKEIEKTIQESGKEEGEWVRGVLLGAARQ